MLTLLRNNLETINAPLARRGIYLESLQLRLSRLPRLKYIGKRILILAGLKYFEDLEDLNTARPL